MPRGTTLLLAAACLAAVAMSTSARADAPPSPPGPRHLIVGTKSSPPFAMKAPDGSWTGLSIELWRQIALDLGATYEVRELELPALLAAVEHHEIDVAVAALTITADREQTMDFTHPIYSTGLSIATRTRSGSDFGAVVSALVTWDLVKVLAGLFLLLAASGAVVWLAERRENPGQFGGSPVHGLGAGLWWSAVTMTTVGYGDKAPITPLGRMVALAWMFAAIIVFSFFTASVTSTLTVQRLSTAIAGPNDLATARVGTVPSSTSELYLNRRHLPFESMASVTEGVKAVDDGDLDAMVYDAPQLRYIAKQLGGDVVVLPGTFQRQDYGFAVPPDSPLREQINRALLRELNSERWLALREHYLGAP